MQMARWAALAGVVALAVSGCGTANSPGQPGGGTASSTATAVPATCPGGVITGVGPEAENEPTQEILGAYADRCDFKSSVSFQTRDSDESRQMFGNALSTWLTVQQPLAEADRQRLADRCARNPVWQLPTSAAPLVLTWNLPGVEELTLTPEAVAKLLSGEISRWDDPQLKQLNPKAALPGIAVAPVLSTDSPDTIATLTDWLTTAAGPVWRAGRTSAWNGPGKHTETLTDAVSTVLGTPGTLSVLPLPYTRTNSLPTAAIDFGAGVVAPTPEAASRALARAEVSEGEGVLVKPDYRAEPGVYPLNTVAYQVVCSKGNNSKQGPVLRDLFSFWTTSAEQQALADLGLAPLPDQVRVPAARAAARIG